MIRPPLLALALVSTVIVSALIVTPVLTPPPGTAPPGEGSSASAALPERPDPRVDGVEMFFSELHDPFGASLPGSVLVDLWDEINRLYPAGADPRGVGEEPPWQLIGPRAMEVPDADTDNEYQGRVLDIEIEDSFTDLRVAAASGGLWWMNTDISVAPQPIADNLESLAIGSFATDPTNPNRIIVGTGEPGPLEEPDPGVFDYSPYRAGVGMFVTNDLGQTWINPLGGVPPRPDVFYRIRWDPSDPVKVFALSERGIYRSMDAGASWEWPAPQLGVFTDIAFHPFDPNVMWASRWHQTNAAMDDLGGLYRSTDGGASWTQLASAPIADVGRTSISVVSNDPSSVRIYLSVGRHEFPDDFLGVFRSTDGGASFTQVTSPDDLDDQQAWYNNAIAAKPSDPDIVLLGWRRLFRSADGGDSWTEIDVAGGLHVDHHLIRWTDDGHVYLATDGGVYVSADDGVNWETDNRYPITQFFHIDVDPADNISVAGASTDNGFCTSDDPIADGGIWKHRQAGDAYGVAYVRNALIDPIWWTNGPKSGDHLYRNYLTLDNGDIIVEQMNGIEPSAQWFRPVRTPRGQGGLAVTAADGFVYRWNSLDEWLKLNQIEFDAAVKDICVVDDDSEVLWVTTSSKAEGVDRVLYRDAGGNWFERSAGLPDSAAVRRVSGDRYGGHPQLGYAIMNGMSSTIDGQRLFKTTDGGVTWANITGNLPDLPVFDLVANPLDDDFLYLATEMGAFRSSNGGSTWVPWNTGWPRATIVTEFVPAFDLEFQHFWIYAATFGRSAWRRNLSRTIALDAAPATVELDGIAASPNPFRSSTSFRVLLEGPGVSEITVHDVRGRAVRRVSFPGTRGWNRITWDGRDDRGRAVAAGTYFVVIRTPLGRFRSKVTRLN